MIQLACVSKKKTPVWCNLNSAWSRLQVNMTADNESFSGQKRYQAWGVCVGGGWCHGPLLQVSAGLALEKLPDKDVLIFPSRLFFADIFIVSTLWFCRVLPCYCSQSTPLEMHSECRELCMRCSCQARFRFKRHSDEKNLTLAWLAH